MKNVFLLFAFLGFISVSESVQAFKNVCDRSSKVQDLFEEKFNKHCSQITEADLKSLTDSKLTIYLQKGESILADDFSGLAARTLSISPLADLHIQPGAFNGASLNSLLIADLFTAGGDRHSFTVESNVFSGLELDSLMIKDFSLDIKTHAFSNLKVKDLSLWVSHSIFGDPVFLKTTGYPFADLLVEDFSLHFVSPQQTLDLRKYLFAGASIARLNISGSATTHYKFDLGVFLNAKLGWAKLKNLGISSQVENTLKSLYPDTLFSF